MCDKSVAIIFYLRMCRLNWQFSFKLIHLQVKPKQRALAEFACCYCCCWSKLTSEVEDNSCCDYNYNLPREDADSDERMLLLLLLFLMLLFISRPGIWVVTGVAKACLCPHPKSGFSLGGRLLCNQPRRHRQDDPNLRPASGNGSPKYFVIIIGYHSQQLGRMAISLLSRYSISISTHPHPSDLQPRQRRGDQYDQHQTLHPCAGNLYGIVHLAMLASL